MVVHCIVLCCIILNIITLPRHLSSFTVIFLAVIMTLSFFPFDCKVLKSSGAG